jgi:hypothetical protein
MEKEEEEEDDGDDEFCFLNSLLYSRFEKYFTITLQ